MSAVSTLRKYLPSVVVDAIIAEILATAAPAEKIAYITSSTISPGPDVDTTADVVYITSSGSGGTEYINIPVPSWPPSAQAVSAAGHLIKISMLALTDPADSPRIYLNGSGVFNATAAQDWGHTNPGLTFTGVVMDYEGALTVFQPIGDWVLWRRDLGDYNDNTALAQLRNGLFSPDSTTDGVQGGQIEIRTGNATVGNANGGPAYIIAGHGHGTGHGGPIILQAGDGGDTDADGGNVLIQPGAKSGAGNDGELVLNLRAFTNATGVVTMTNGPTGISGNPDRWMKVNVGGFHAAIPIWFVQGQ